MDSNYSIKLKTLDILLFLSCAWAEFGYAFFSQTASLNSVEDPVTRYASLNDDQMNTVTNILHQIVQVLAFSSSLLTIFTVLNMKMKRETLIQDFSKGIKHLKQREINPIFFIVNILFLIYTFVIGSLTPWAGLNASGHNSKFVKIAGPTMFLGEFVLFLTSNARFFFATAQNLTNTYAMPRQDKIEKIKAIFCTKEGWRFFLSTIANAGNRSWEFWGACSYIMLYVFLTTNKYKTIPIAAIVIISSFYQTLFCQSASDYETVFDKKQNNEKKEFNMLGKAVILIPLFILQLFTLILKTLQTPSLYTGVIDDPEKDYTIIITFIAFLGLIGGGFGGYQSAFGYNGPLAKQAMRDLLPNCFFKKLMGEPLLNKSHKYTRVAPLEITQDSTLH